MLRFRTSFVRCLLSSLAVVFGCGALASTVLHAADFAKPALLRRFDSDGDGALSEAERRKLRESFGGVDVPMLPDNPYNYADSRLGAKATDSLSATDNTPHNNRLTDAGAALGRVLFYDRQLSVNNKIACASCHDQRRAFADPRQFSVGFAGGRTGRNAMALQNMAFTNIRGGRPGFFWDERAATLEDQVLMPIQDEVEMGMKLSALERKLQQLPYYPALFEEAFGTATVTSNRVARAVAQFMRSMISFDSKFDRAARSADGDYSLDFDEFSEQENFGKSLFVDGVGGVAEIGCGHCHVPPTFGMPKSFNNGLDREYVDRGLGARNVPSNDPFTPSNDGKFKASSLRNVVLTAPYMHDGRFKTLEDVISHYSSGVHPHANLGIAFNDRAASDGEGGSGFRFSASQSAALIAFLKTLTDHSFVSDPRFADPFVRLDEQPENLERKVPNADHD